jgi:hypothetical protein
VFALFLIGSGSGTKEKRATWSAFVDSLFRHLARVPTTDPACSDGHSAKAPVSSLYASRLVEKGLSPPAPSLLSLPEGEKIEESSQFLCRVLIACMVPTQSTLLSQHPARAMWRASGRHIADKVRMVRMVSGRPKDGNEQMPRPQNPVTSYKTLDNGVRPRSPMTVRCRWTVMPQLHSPYILYRWMFQGR